MEKGKHCNLCMYNVTYYVVLGRLINLLIDQLID